VLAPLAFRLGGFQHFPVVTAKLLNLFFGDLWLQAVDVNGPLALFNGALFNARADGFSLFFRSRELYADALSSDFHVLKVIVKPVRFILAVEETKRELLSFFHLNLLDFPITHSFQFRLEVCRVSHVDVADEDFSPPFAVFAGFHLDFCALEHGSVFFHCFELGVLGSKVDKTVLSVNVFASSSSRGQLDRNYFTTVCKKLDEVGFARFKG